MNKPILMDEGLTNESSGGHVGYYIVGVDDPISIDQSYVAECGDIIEALDMSFAEGEAFKAIWRMCAARQGRGKKGNTSRRDAEKIVYYAERIMAKAERDKR